VEETDSEAVEEIEDHVGNDVSSNFPPVSVYPPINMLPFDWKKEDRGYAPNLEDFSDPDAGWTPIANNCGPTEFDSFLKIFCPEAMDFCIYETNQYAHQQKMTANHITRRMKAYKDLDEADFMRFLAVRIIMGIDRKPSQKHYWTRNEMLTSTILPKLLTSDRYFEILQNLHFCDQAEESEDHLFKLRGIWSICTSQFAKMIVPGPNISIDESLVLYEGRLIFKQLIPSKRSRFGMKIFLIVDESTGFILNMIIYTGQGHPLKFNPKDLGYGGAVALELLTPYLQQHRTVYMDNYFTGPILARHLLTEKTYLCGTLRKNRKYTPSPERMAKGEVTFFTSQNILIQHWKNKKVVSIISSRHKHEMQSVVTRSGRQMQKPSTVLDYNKLARGTDLSDMVMQSYNVLRKSKIWYKKLFFHLIDACIHNAFLLFRTKFNTNCQFLQLRLNLVRQIIGKYGFTQRKSPNQESNLSKFQGQHFLGKNKLNKNGKISYIKCRICIDPKSGKIRKETPNHCKQCNVPLCAVPCFEIFHTK